MVLNIEKVSKKTLPNGVRVVYIKRKGPIVIQINFKAGSRYDPKGKRGLAHLSEHIISNSSPKYGSQRERDKRLELIGGYSRPSTSRERIIFEATFSDRKHLAQVIELLNDEMALGELSEEHMVEEKGIVETEMLQDLADQSSLTRLWADTFLGGDLIHDPLGTTKSIRNIGVDDIKNYHEYMLRSSCTVVIIGELSMNTVMEGFSWLPKQETVFSTKIQPPTESRSEQTSNMENTVNLLVGVNTEGITDLKGQTVLKFIQAYLLSAAISPVFRRLRHEKGLIYSYDVDNAVFSDIGAFDISTIADKGNYPEVEGIIREILWNLAVDGISEEDLSFTKQYIQYSAPVWYETSKSITDEYSLGESLSPEKYLDLENYLASVNSITHKNILKVTSKYFEEENIKVCVRGDTS